MRFMLCVDVQRELRNGVIPEDGTPLHAHVSNCLSCNRVDSDQVTAARHNATKASTPDTLATADIGRLITREGIARVVANGLRRDLPPEIMMAYQMPPTGKLRKTRKRANQLPITRQPCQTR